MSKIDDGGPWYFKPEHRSDCAMNNMPALPASTCSCGEGLRALIAFAADACVNEFPLHGADVLNQMAHVGVCTKEAVEKEVAERTKEPA